MFGRRPRLAIIHAMALVLAAGNPPSEFHAFVAHEFKAGRYCAALNEERHTSVSDPASSESQPLLHKPLEQEASLSLNPVAKYIVLPGHPRRHSGQPSLRAGVPSPASVLTLHSEGVRLQI